MEETAMAPTPPSVFARIEALLKAARAEYDVLRHEPVYTSEEAARVRGAALASGAKALVCKADDRFVMFVVPANLRLDSRHVRRQWGCRKLRFASRDEVLERTGLKPGSIPPFGSLFELGTFCDGRLGEHDRINFNAGDHCVSVSMTYADYLRIEQPELGAWATSEE